MLPYLAVLLAAVCFGTTGTAQAFGPDASALSIGAVRILIGGGVLAGVALALRMRRLAREGAPGRAQPDSAQPGPLPSGAVGPPSARQVPSWLLLLIGALGVLAYQPAFFLGTSLNGVAVGTVVALGSAPIITGLLDWALHRRFPGAIWLIATLVATVGVVLISGLLGADSGADSAATSSISLPGLLASVGAGASYAVYTLASKALLERGWTPSSTMGSVFGLAAAFSLPVLLATDTRWLATGEGIAMALWLGLVTTAAAYLLFGWGLARLRASTVSTLTLAEPLTATVLGTVVLGETLSAMAVAGLVVLAAGLAILAVPWRGKGADAAPVNAAS